MKKLFLLCLLLFVSLPSAQAMEVLSSEYGFALSDVGFFQQLAVNGQSEAKEKFTLISVEKNATLTLYVTTKANTGFPDFVPQEKILTRSSWQTNIIRNTPELFDSRLLSGRTGVVYTLKQPVDQYIIYGLKKYADTYYKVELLVPGKYLAKGQQIVLEIIRTILPLGDQYMQESTKRIANNN